MRHLLNSNQGSNLLKMYFFERGVFYVTLSRNTEKLTDQWHKQQPRAQYIIYVRNFKINSSLNRTK